MVSEGQRMAMSGGCEGARLSDNVVSRQRFGSETDRRPAASRALLRRLQLWT